MSSQDQGGATTSHGMHPPTEPAVPITLFAVLQQVLPPVLNVLSIVMLAWAVIGPLWGFVVLPRTTDTGLSIYFKDHGMESGTAIRLQSFLVALFLSALLIVGRAVNQRARYALTEDTPQFFSEGMGGAILSRTWAAVGLFIAGLVVPVIPHTCAALLAIQVLSKMRLCFSGRFGQQRLLTAIVIISYVGLVVQIASLIYRSIVGEGSGSA